MIKNLDQDILLEIVNNILDITKVEAGKTTLNNNPYSLADTISKLSHMVKMSLTETPIKFSVEINGNIPNTLMGDEVKVYQILMNILSNAVKYTKNGYVDFSVRCVTQDDICRLIIMVKDTGIGIKKENVDKLFEKLFYLKNIYLYH